MAIPWSGELWGPSGPTLVVVITCGSVLALRQSPSSIRESAARTCRLSRRIAGVGGQLRQDDRRLGVLDPGQNVVELRPVTQGLRSFQQEPPRPGATPRACGSPTGQPGCLAQGRRRQFRRARGDEGLVADRPEVRRQGHLGEPPGRRCRGRDRRRECRRIVLRAGTHARGRRRSRQAEAPRGHQRSRLSQVRREGGQALARAPLAWSASCAGPGTPRRTPASRSEAIGSRSFRCFSAGAGCLPSGDLYSTLAVARRTSRPSMRTACSRIRGSRSFNASIAALSPTIACRTHRARALSTGAPQPKSRTSSLTTGPSAVLRPARSGPGRAASCEATTGDLERDNQAEELRSRPSTPWPSTGRLGDDLDRSGRWSGHGTSGRRRPSRTSRRRRPSRRALRSRRQGGTRGRHWRGRPDPRYGTRRHDARSGKN